MGTQGNQAGEFGRVGDDGTVYVRVGTSEHAVGQYPAGTPEEALAFFAKRYDGLLAEVQLLEQRVRTSALAPDSALDSINQMVTQLSEPKAVGDIGALIVRLDALRPLIGLQRGKRREEKAQRLVDSRARKEQIVAEAEKLARGRNWHNGADRLRDLLAEWKDLPRLDKVSDDELWHRFSTARTTYTRARKAHFSELKEKRAEAAVVKEKLVGQAQDLADSTEWGPTSGKYRSMMAQWKAAGPAPKEVENELWGRFRAAQDTFFEARDAANAQETQEFAANAEKKQALLAEAEALLPVTDVNAAKRAFREIADRWDAAGKVPREQMKSLEARIRKVEQAIRSVEDQRWAKSDPEKSARADDLVGKLEKAIAEAESKLAAAQESGDTAGIKKLEADLASRRAFLEMASKAASEFS